LYEFLFDLIEKFTVLLALKFELIKLDAKKSNYGNNYFFDVFIFFPKKHHLKDELLNNL